MFRRLDEQVMVAGQIGPEDVAAAAAQGITAIVNNRPDGEEPGQPSGAEIEAAARAAGLAYHHIPVSGAITPEAVARMTTVLEGGDSVLAFCRSGTRSTWLWALAEASRGVDGETLILRASEAGYDLEPLRPYFG
jgi:uncharacterized protein (TIGR01244 family)